MTPAERIAAAPGAWITLNPDGTLAWDTLSPKQEISKALYDRYPRSAISGSRVVPVALVELNEDEVVR